MLTTQRPTPSAELRPREREGALTRLVIVADNPLIVGAIRLAMRERGAFQLLGYLDARKATAGTITRAGADVVLVDEADQSEHAIALIQSLTEHNEDITVIVLTVHMEGEWVARAFAAGATGAISKAIQPAALMTVLRESLNGHIVHSPISLRAQNGVNGFSPSMLGEEHSSLTERELEILQLVVAGATNGEIARQLWITQQTVKFHVSNIYRKLDVANRTEACHYAHVNGLVAPKEPLPVVMQRQAFPVAS